jgi:hypothetical protein
MKALLLLVLCLAGGDCPAYKEGGRKCRGKLKDFVLDWEAALPEEDLIISDAHSMMADLRYGYPVPVVPASMKKKHIRFLKKLFENVS